MRKETRHTSSFGAVDDSGRRHTLHVFAQCFITGIEGDPPIEGNKGIRTAEGQHLNRMEKGVYQTSEGDMTYRSDDPNAP